MITQIEDYFSLGCGRCERFKTAACSALRWERGLRALRQLCVEAALVEEVKWGHPCYTHKGRNVAIIGALRDDFRLSFFHAALMTDPDGVLERQGPNTQHPDMIRFRDSAQVEAMGRIILAYLREARRYADAGTLPPKDTAPLALPPELAAALAADPALAQAFARLSPGRQKSHVLHVSAAKRPQTRAARVIASRDRILAGVGALER